MANARGVPWWGALACAVAAILIGFIIDSSHGSQLTWVFTVLYFVGCVAAVLIVRNRSLFTAIAQPPLLLLVAVPLAYRSFVDHSSVGIKGILFDMALPLVDRFPTMIVTTVVVWIIGAFRVTLYVQGRKLAVKGPARSGAARQSAAKARPRPTGASRSTPAAGNVSGTAGGRRRAEPGMRRRAAGSPPRTAAGPRDAGTPEPPRRPSAAMSEEHPVNGVASTGEQGSPLGPRARTATIGRASAPTAGRSARSSEMPGPVTPGAEPAHPVPHVRYRGD